MSMQSSGRTLRAVIAAALLAGAGSVAVPGCSRPAGSTATPHVEHMVLPAHKVWRVISVQPYEGLEEVELVKVDWPTEENPRLAFALTREDLKAGDPVCLDHILEIDTLWAHPVPQGGCEARAPRASAGQ